MAVTFPNSPTLNQEYTAENGLIYIWDGEKWKTQGSYDADAGNYINKDGSNTALFADATTVGIGTTTPTESLEVSGGYTLAGGGLKVSGGTADVAGTIYRRPAIGAQTGDYVAIEETNGYLEVGRRTDNSYIGVNAYGANGSPDVNSVYGYNTTLTSPRQGLTTTVGYDCRVTDVLSSTTEVVGYQAGGAWANLTSPNSYGFKSEVNASATGNKNFAFYAGGTANSYFGGSVGIGTDSPSAKLDLRGGNAHIMPAGINPWQSDASEQNSGLFLGKDGRLDAYQLDTGSFSYLTAAEIDTTTGASTVKFSVNNGGGIFTDSGLILQTGATLLDDYEEGSFTPSYGNATSTSHARQYGRYTKVGNKVTLWIWLRLNSFSASSSAWVHITGLPFTIRNEDIGSGMAYIGSAANFNAYPTSGFGFKNTNEFYLRKEQGVFTWADMINGSNRCDLHCVFQHFI